VLRPIPSASSLSAIVGTGLGGTAFLAGDGGATTASGGRGNTGLFTPGSTPGVAGIYARNAVLIRPLTDMPRDRANATTAARSPRDTRQAKG
jgi:hypothetical protein